MVILSHRTFSFKNLNKNSILIILMSRESLRFFGWDERVSFNKNSHDSTNSFNTQTQRCDIQQKNIFSRFILRKNSTLNSSTISDSFIRVNTTVWFFTIEKVFQQLLNFRNTSRTTNKNNFINFSLRKTRIFKSFFNRTHSFLEKSHI
mmetsp:Transcript_3882/g.5706  ORF Transcript_3882/g.5706 Transcript_3882/m.5706 type:complete len:148 (+) Transcript_3882:558-1001(+)